MQNCSFFSASAVRMIAARTNAKGGIDLIGSGELVDAEDRK
jgi:hypothetical protein